MIESNELEKQYLKALQTIGEKSQREVIMLADKSIIDKEDHETIMHAMQRNAVCQATIAQIQAIADMKAQTAHMGGITVGGKKLMFPGSN